MSSVIHILKFPNLLLLISLLLSNSCHTTEVNSDYDSKINFSSYKTFSVCLDDFQINSYKHPEYNSEKMKNQLKNAIESEMQKYYKVDDASPELHVGLNVKIEDKKLTYRSCDSKSVYHEWPECRLKTYEYTEGTLLIFVADVSKNQLIWQASITGITSNDLIENEKLINRLVQNLFQKFPLYKDEGAAS